MAHLLLLALALPTTARAHSQDMVDVIDLSERPGGQAFDLELSVGLAILDDSEGRWVCHEAITADDAIQAPDYAHRADGGWIAALRDPAQGRDGASTWFSADGCDWTAATGLDGLGLAALATDPSDVDHALGVAVDASGSGALVESVDGGASWVPVDLLSGVPVHDVYFHDSGAGWVAASDALWVQVDGTWTSRPAPGPGVDPLRIAALTDADGWVVVDPLVEADTVWHSTDGGASWTAVDGLDGEVIDAVADPAGGAWFQLDGQRAVHSPTGAEVVHRGIGLGVAAGEVWHTSHPEETGWMAATLTADGLEPVWFPTDVVAPLDCPAGSDTATICEPLWPALETRLALVGQQPEPADTGGFSDDDGVELASRCGCAHGGSSHVLPWLALLIFARRR